MHLKLDILWQHYIIILHKIKKYHQAFCMNLHFNFSEMRYLKSQSPTSKWRMFDLISIVWHFCLLELSNINEFWYGWLNMDMGKAGCFQLSNIHFCVVARHNALYAILHINIGLVDLDHKWGNLLHHRKIKILYIQNH